MRRVALFVDDEQRILDGLRRGLRGLRHEWDLRFALGGERALEALDDDVDVVVSDMRMPGLDGADVLTSARERSPRAARVILSGNSDRSASRRVTGLAHRFLAKPCDALDLQALLPVLAACAAGAPAVPGFRAPGVHPARAARLHVLLADGAPGAVELVEQEPGLALVLLHAASSSSFAPARPCADVREALEHLGPAVVAELLEEPGLLDGGSTATTAPGTAPATVRALAGLAPLLPAGGLGPLLALWGLAPDLVAGAVAADVDAAA